MKEQATQNLKQIKGILDDLGITFWLDGGTLLGAYRDKDFCEDDEDDIDLCTWDNYLYLMDAIIEQAKALGFEVWHKWQLEIALTKNGSKIDLFFNKRNKKDAYTHLYDGEMIHSYVVIPIKFYENLVDIQFKGETFKAPSPTEEYLSLKYGDWQTPIHRSKYSCVNAEQNKLVRKTYDI